MSSDGVSRVFSSSSSVQMPSPPSVFDAFYRGWSLERASPDYPKASDPVGLEPTRRPKRLVPQCRLPLPAPQVRRVGCLRMDCDSLRVYARVIL
jgi:hypothetical protein